jgi:hypothetical protein
MAEPGDKAFKKKDDIKKNILKDTAQVKSDRGKAPAIEKNFSKIEKENIAKADKKVNKKEMTTTSITIETEILDRLDIFTFKKGMKAKEMKEKKRSRTYWIKEALIQYMNREEDK